MELMIVVVILGILTAISVPLMKDYSERVRLTADKATLKVLNSVTSVYTRVYPYSGVFDNEDMNSVQLMAILAEEGYLDSVVIPQTKGLSFVWVFQDKRWQLLSDEALYEISLADGLTIDASGGHVGYLKGTYGGAPKDIIIPVKLDGTPILNIWQDTFNNKGLTTVSFESSSQIKRIHARAFYRNELSYVNLPVTLERIDLWSFMNNNLTEIKLPPGLNYIEQRAFDGNDLKKITIGANVTVIQDRAFGPNTEQFKQAYSSNGAGTYILNNGNWVKQ